MATILIVDDDAGMLEVMVATLDRKGHTVVASRNGREALEVLRDQAFDLVICDIIMPEVNGVEVLMELKKMQPETRLIAVSGFESHLRANNFLVMARNLGAYRTITKPFKMSDLAEAVEDSLN